jgi:hypothetical protein
MRRRLQVLLDDREYAEIRESARRRGLTVSEWVRQTIRSAHRRESAGDPARKLAVVRAAIRHSFPTADIEQMLEETERAYQACRD